jgi:hypothetical protein
MARESSLVNFIRFCLLANIARRSRRLNQPEPLGFSDNPRLAFTGRHGGVSNAQLKSKLESNRDQTRIQPSMYFQ